ncbi:hypothetical protein WAI453_012740 [Rhynchosporium graminicola]|uniref:Uncharacterized protein n=1 Tax=Rhynchosporium graminicola TaxID=2792576 RepID=A0A1E1KQA4_9HELO|nr:uncharacterized protein RCO7_08392 [Rhynchosporium commune]
MIPPNHNSDRDDYSDETDPDPPETSGMLSMSATHAASLPSSSERSPYASKPLSTRTPVSPYGSSSAADVARASNSATSTNTKDLNKEASTSKVPQAVVATLKRVNTS